jgi:hypothetical protein
MGYRKPEATVLDARLGVHAHVVVSYRWYRFVDQPAMAQLTKEFPRVFTDAHALGRRKQKVVLEALLP